MVRYLLEQGGDRDRGNVEGGTPLHHAAHMGDLEILLLLMSYGADLNARSSDGQLPIDLALREDIRQAIRDEPRRRMDHGLKRATEQDIDEVTIETTNNLQQNVQYGEEEEYLAVFFERLTCTKQKSSNDAEGKKEKKRLTCTKQKSSNVAEGKKEEDSDDDSGTSDEEDN